MKYDDICSVVAQRAAVDRTFADRAVKATLQALSEQTDSAAFDHLAAELPPEFAKSPDPPDRPERRTQEEFLVRVATLADTPATQVRRPVRAVFAAISAAASAEALHAAIAPLGEDVTALLPPPDELRDAGNFLEAVRERAGVETSAEAEAATRASLDALAERITAGQANDLAVYLPPALRSRLESTGTEAQPFDYSEFLARISEQRALAEAHARAVLATIRETAPEPEIQNTLAQLPDDLARLFA